MRRRRSRLLLTALLPISETTEGNQEKKHRRNFCSLRSTHQTSEEKKNSAKAEAPTVPSAARNDLLFCCGLMFSNNCLCFWSWVVGSVVRSGIGSSLLRTRVFMLYRGVSLLLLLLSLFGRCQNCQKCIRRRRTPAKFLLFSELPTDRQTD